MSILQINEELIANVYPGRGIIMGRSEDNQKAIIAYFIMGRSENSRNRIFEETQDGIRTKAFDESKMTDPSLIIYHPVRRVGGKTIVTNGDQTDTVAQALAAGGDYISALRTRTFEPDAPNYTPRISAVLEENGSYAFSILKSCMGNPDSAQRAFYEYEAPVAGVGHFLHTYQCDGDPLPSFRGEPKAVHIQGDLQSFADMLWEFLNEPNKVSLFVQGIDLKTGARETIIKNKLV